MPRTRTLARTSVYTKAAVLRRFGECAIKEAHAWRLWSFLIRRPGSSWWDVPNFPKAACAVLEAEFATSTVKLLRASKGDEATKLLLELQDGKRVETVIMQYDTRGFGDDEATENLGHYRATVCVSSQIGCRMGCKFCATGTMGLNGNLTSGEIIEQLLIAQAKEPFRNVVFMGMGEPLDNYESVRDAVELLTSSKGFGLARRRVTISTVGVHSKFQNLAEDLPGVSLAFSLHAATQDVRQSIVPSARAYKLDRLMDALESYQQKTQQRVFVEYVLLSGLNDSSDQAHQLGQLLTGKDVVINLIPFNPVYAPGVDFSPPSDVTVRAFQRVLSESYRLRTTIRKEKGQDISGACGQLALQAVSCPDGLELF